MSPSPPFTPPHAIIINTVGIFGLVCSLVYRIPQIYKTYKTRSAVDLSIGTIVIQNISYTAYIVYGVLVWDWIYISGCLISFLQNVLILVMRRYYIRHPESGEAPIKLQSISSIRV